MIYLIVKRFFDFVFSLTILLTLSPFLILISIILIMTGEHAVFYFQTRIGHRNVPFAIWKFATMIRNSAKIGTKTITVPGDCRVLPFGRFLRFTKINELPQLVNILLGQMSFVGPRPMVKRGWEKYPDEFRNVIYNVKPGLTGIGSVVFRNEAELVAKLGGDPREVYINIIFPHKGKLELWYQENISFITDLKIIFLTAWVILFPKSKIYKKWFKTLPEIIL